MKEDKLKLKSLAIKSMVTGPKKQMEGIKGGVPNATVSYPCPTVLFCPTSPRLC